MSEQRSANIALIIETIKDWMKHNPGEFIPRAPEALKGLVLPDDFKYNFTECKFRAFRDLEKSGYQLEYTDGGKTVAKLVNVNPDQLMEELHRKVSDEAHEKENLSDFMEVKKMPPNSIKKPVDHGDDEPDKDKDKPKYAMVLRVDDDIRRDEMNSLGETLVALSHVPPDTVYTVKLQITKAHK